MTARMRLRRSLAIARASNPHRRRSADPYGCLPPAPPRSQASYHRNAIGAREGVTLRVPSGASPRFCACEGWTVGQPSQDIDYNQRVDVGDLERRPGDCNLYPVRVGPFSRKEGRWRSLRSSGGAHRALRPCAPFRSARGGRSGPPVPPRPPPFLLRSLAVRPATEEIDHREKNTLLDLLIMTTGHQSAVKPARGLLHFVPALTGDRGQPMVLAKVSSDQTTKKKEPIMDSKRYYVTATTFQGECDLNPTGEFDYFPDACDAAEGLVTGEMKFARANVWMIIPRPDGDRHITLREFRALPWD